MKKIILFNLIFLTTALMAEPLSTWYYKEGDIGSSIALYSYKGEIYGRLIANHNGNGEVIESLKDPQTRAEKIEGSPYIVGMDFMWGFKEEKKNNYTGGIMIDPETGKKYECSLEIKGDTMIVKIKFLFLTIDQKWKKVEHPVLIDGDFIPIIPKAR